MADDLQGRVQRLEDLLEIQQLFIDYGQHLDAGNFEAYASLFATEGEVQLGPMGRAKGRENIRALMEKVLDGRIGASFHIIGSPMITLEGDRATSEVMWTVVRRGEDGLPGLGAIGRHRDELVREDGRWRFQKRRGFVDIPSTMP